MINVTFSGIAKCVTQLILASTPCQAHVFFSTRYQSGKQKTADAIHYLAD